MAIAYKSAGAGAMTETNGASLNLPCPATVAANDILIAHVVVWGTTYSPTTPSGWTLLFGPYGLGTGTPTARAWVYGKIATGNEDATNVNFGAIASTTGRMGRIYSFSGYVSGDITDVVPSASYAGNSSETDPVIQSVTTTVEGAKAIALVSQDDNNYHSSLGAVSGGSWAEAVADYVSSSVGPSGGCLQLQVGTPTSDPGTIAGGTVAGNNDEANTICFEIRPNVPNSPPTVELNSPEDEATTYDTTPDLEFTGTDPEDDDVSYEVQIDTVNTFDSVGEEVLIASQETTYVATTFDSNQKFVGQSFTGTTGTLSKYVSKLRTASGTPTGNLVARLYSHTGTYGTSSCGSTLLATSDNVDVSTLSSSATDINFNFSGSERYSLVGGTYYVIGVFYEAVGGTIQTYVANGDVCTGNYCSINSLYNWNYSSSQDIYFKVYTANKTPLIDKISTTDAGFSGDPDSTDPFASAQAVTYTVQSALDPDTYYWRVRGKNPSGTFGDWSDIQSFILASGTQVNDARDAKISGVQTLTNDRDAKITGKLTANSARSATITGVMRPTSDRSAKIVGKDTTNDYRNAKITGKSTATANCSAKVTGIIYDRYWIGGTGNWSDTAHWSYYSGGSGGATVPNSTNDVFIDSNSGFGSGGEIDLGVEQEVLFKDFTCTSGHTYSIHSEWSYVLISGSIQLESGLSFTGDYDYVGFDSNDSETLTINGATISTGFYIGGSGSWTLQDNLEITGEFYQENGTFDANDHNITANDFYFYADTDYTPTVIMGSGTWEVAGEEGQFSIEQYADEVVTITPETSTIKFTGTDQELYFDDDTGNEAGKTFNNLWIVGTGTTTGVYGSNTFNDFKVDTPPHTIKFEENKTQTVATWDVSGTVGNLITINSYHQIGIATSHLSNAGTGYSVDDRCYHGSSVYILIHIDGVDGSGAITSYHIVESFGDIQLATEYRLSSGQGDNNAVIVIDSLTEISQHTLSKSSGTVSCDYLDISNSNTIPAPEVCDSYSESNLNGQWNNVGFVGQSFTGDGGVLDKTVGCLVNSSSATGTICSKIYSHKGTYGSSSQQYSLLATSDDVDVATIGSQFELVEFTFSGDQKITLTNSEHYVVIFQRSGTGVHTAIDSSSPTHDGNMISSEYGYQANYDLCFYVYTDVPTATWYAGEHSVDSGNNDGWLFPNSDSILSKLTGKQISNSEISSKLSGIDTDTDEVSAKTFGQDTDSDSILSKLTGKDTSSDSILAKVTGQTFSDDEIQSKIKGKDTDFSQIDSKITGKDTDDSQVNAKVKGKDTSSSEVNAKLKGKDTASSSILSKVVGKETSSDEIAVKTIGKDTSNSQISAKLTGTAILTNDEIQAKTFGQDQATNQINSKITGQDTTNDEILSKIVGKQITSDEINSKLSGIDTTSNEISAKIRGKDTTGDQVLSKLSGQDITNDEVQSKVKGKDTAYDEVSAKIKGKLTTDDEISSKVHGQTQDNSSVSAKLIGKDRSVGEINSKLIGKETTQEEIDSKLTGVDISSDEILSVLTGQTLTSSEKQAKLKGKQLTGNEISAKLKGKDSTDSQIQAKTKGKQSTQSEQNAKVVGQGIASSEKSAKLSGLNYSQDNLLAKVVGQKIDQSLILAKTHGQDFSSDEVKAKIAGKVSDQSEINSKVKGKQTTNNEISVVIVGKEISNSEISSKLTGQLATYSQTKCSIKGKVSEIGRLRPSFVKHYLVDDNSSVNTVKNYPVSNMKLRPTK